MRCTHSLLFYSTPELTVCGLSFVQISKLETLLPRLATRGRKLLMEEDAVRERSKQLATDISAAELETRPRAEDSNKLEQLKAQGVAATKVHSKAATAAEKVARKVEKLRNAINEAGGEEMKLAQAASEAAIAALAEGVSAVSKATVAVKAEAKKAEKAERAMHMAKEESERVRQANEQAKKDFKAIEDQVRIPFDLLALLHVRLINLYFSRR